MLLDGFLVLIDPFPEVVQLIDIVLDRLFIFTSVFIDVFNLWFGDECLLDLEEV